MENNDYDKITQEHINNNYNKKLILPTLVAVLTLIVLAVGASYAYITVQTTNEFKTANIKGSVPPIGSVALSEGKSLTLEVTRQQMMKEQPGTYYATLSGMSETDSNMQTISTAKVTGEGTFTCDYTINVKASGELFSSAKDMGADLLTLEVNGETNKYDFNNDQTALTAEAGVDIIGQFTGLTESNTTTGTASNSIQARFKLVNSDTANQSNLNGKSGTITFSVKTFTCTATN